MLLSFSWSAWNEYKNNFYSKQKQTQAVGKFFHTLKIFSMFKLCIRVQLPDFRKAECIFLEKKVHWTGKKIVSSLAEWPPPPNIHP